MNICENILSVLQQMYSIPVFREAKAWCLTENEYRRSPTHYFHSEILIDIYRGREPYLLDIEFSTKEKAKVNFANTFIIDSNVAGAIDQIIKGKKYNKEVVLLICNIAKTHEELGVKLFDINPTFYILESKSKNAAYEHVVSNIESIVTLQHMDVCQFNKTGNIILDKKQLTFLEKTYNTSFTADIAEKIYNSYSEDQVSSYEKSVKIIYVILLTLTVIYKESEKENIFLTAFLDFLQNELCVCSLREIILGIAFIENTFTKLLPLRKTNKNKLLSTIYNTSWDISLLRIPELLLRDGTRNLTYMGYIATLEKELIEYSKIFYFLFSLSAYGESNTNFRICDSLIGKYEKILGPYMAEDFLLKRAINRKDISIHEMDKLIFEKEEILTKILS